MKVLTEKKAIRQMENDRWYEILSQSDNHKTRKHAERMKNCSGYMEIFKNKSSGKLKVFANYCKSRLCCKCARNRANKNRMILEGIVESLSEDDSIRPIELTITMKENCHISDFPVARTAMNKAFANMIRSDLFSGRVGHYKVIEFTNRGEGEIHPHIHCLMHIEKKDLTKEKGVKRMLNSEIFNEEIIIKFNWEKEHQHQFLEPTIDSSLTEEDQFFIYKQDVLDDCHRRLKKGYIPVIMARCLAKKNGLGHQVWITEPKDDYLLNLCKYNTKTMEYQGCEMEELFDATAYTRFCDYSGLYREEKKKNSELFLSDEERKSSNWESMGSVQQNIQDQMLVASNPDPEMVKVLIRLEKTGMIGYSIESVPNFKNWLEDLIEQEE